MAGNFAAGRFLPSSLLPVSSDVSATVCSDVSAAAAAVDNAPLQPLTFGTAINYKHVHEED